MKRILLALTLLSFNQLNAQKSLFLSPSLDYGVPVSGAYGNSGSMVKGHPLAYHLGGNLAAMFRFSDRVSIEAGIGQSYDSWRLKDKAFEERYDGFVVKLANRNWYWNYYFNLQLLQPIVKNDLYVYGRFAYSFNNSSAGTVTQNKTFRQVKLDKFEDVTATSVFVGSNNSFVPEIGVEKVIAGNHTISVGVKFNMGRSDFINGNYTVVDTVGTELFSDTYNSKGSFIGLNVRYNLLLWHQPKKEKPPKEKKPKKPKDPKDPKDPVDTTVVVDVPDKDPPKDTSKVEGRDVDVTHKIHVKNKTVKIQLWDHQMVDGDRVSINLNGRWVLEDYTLQKKLYEFEVELDEGKNLFVLHALNLGRFEPNTAAIIINDGGKEHKIILESTLETSGTIEITYKAPKEKKDKDGDKEDNPGE